MVRATGPVGLYLIGHEAVIVGAIIEAGVVTVGIGASVIVDELAQV